jgi:RNA polymerase sigma-70 factor (ECF subfamily)
MVEPKEWNEWLNKGKHEKLFNAFVDKYTEPLYWQARKLMLRHDLADDVLQDSFINAWKALPKFKAESNFYTWLFRIVCNQSFATLKKEKRYTEIDSNNTVSLNEDPFFNGDQTLLALHTAVESLPVRQQIVFKMRYFQELPYAEISAILLTSEGSLKASYHHAKEKIKKSFNLD